MDGNVSPQSTTTEPKYAFSNREVPVELSRASVSKAEEIWKMQKFAFADLLRKYGDYDTSPANETIDKVKSRFEDPNTYHYFIKVKDKNVGVIRIVDPKTGEKKRLAQIFIMPEYRRNRYAYSAIKKAEKIHGEKDWEVETIFQERYLVKFYMHLGYKTTDKIERVNSKMVLVGLEK
ncbi:MAG: GNAT family N-acetyltransferase [Clostridiales bacterium]|nr:GNAT family N-acetyltransferase [Clostridiales bacterium]